MAALIPKLPLFISLFGALCSSFLTLILPPILEVITFWPETSRWLICKNSLIVAFGLTVFATGSYSSISALVYEFGGATL